MLWQWPTKARRKHVTRSAALGVAAGTLFACTEAPTGARISPSVTPLLSASGDGGPQFFPNRVKYSDAGSKPATGRSGSASTETRALLGKDGVALVEVTTGTLDDGGTPPGQIVKVQTKLFSLDESKAPTINDKDLDGSGYWSESFDGMLRNSKVETQVNVRGIDPERTDVVSAMTLVKLRPDLAAVQVSGPARAYTRTMVDFAALVVEGNGDVGARADCVFSVDGAEVARGPGVWVDAGSSVSCAFRTSFATAGTKNVRIDVTGVTPGDWDVANNSASTTIEIVDPGVPLSYSASAYRYQYSYRQEYSWEYTGGDFGNWTDVGARDESGASIYAWTPNALQFPLASASLSMSRDGSLFRSHAASDVPSFDDPYYGSGAKCFYVWSDGVVIWGCNYDWGYTDFSAGAFGGRVTYFVNGWNSWNGSWSYNADYTYGGGPFDLGTTVGLDLRVTDATGTTYFATPEISIQSEPIDYSFDSCYEDRFYRFKSCYKLTQTGTRWYGSAFRWE